MTRHARRVVLGLLAGAAPVAAVAAVYAAVGSVVQGTYTAAATTMAVFVVLVGSYGVGVLIDRYRRL